MKRYSILAFLVFSFIAGFAQSISVKSFQALPTDLTALSKEGKRIDQNGDVAALIKVVTSETGFTFEGGTLGIVDTKQRNGEIWVWVPRGLRKITVLHQRLGVLRDYRFPIEIEAERSYEMVLVTGKTKVVVEEDIREQYLVFQISPSDAMLEVDDQVWPVSAEGTARRLMNFGTYTYRVQALNYHADAGQVTVNDPDNAKMVTVTLRPNFGWIEVNGDGNLKGAAVYIDNTLAGKAPFKSEGLKSGQHTVKIVREMYEPYSTTVTVNDNETTRVKPQLTADFAHVTLQVDADAEIWVNDERKGLRTWTGDLANGTYKVECRQASHETSMTRMEITRQRDGEVIRLEPPAPIYGSLAVECTPDMATLFIDGKEEGKAPKLIGKILIGTHELKLTKEGYADYTETVTIAKGQRTQVDATLSNGKEMRFTCNVPNAQLEIDGTVVGRASGTYMLTYGSHSLRATTADYQDYTATLSVSASGGNGYSIQMKRLSKEEETFTVNGVSFTMKLVEGGTFQMGYDQSDADFDEKPVHSVTVSSYYIGETEVTQALWQAVMGTTVRQQRDKASGLLRGEGSDYPMYFISWDECQEFIRKLNQKTGRNFRLPTEAEWEYAARGGKKSKGYKYAGSNTVGNVAWYSENSGNDTHAVKTKSPNELGLYDMSGNVWEWCQDWRDNYGNESQTNPTGPSSGTYRIMRGGAWYCDKQCRVSYRQPHEPVERRNSDGFRLCLPQ